MKVGRVDYDIADSMKEIWKVIEQEMHIDWVDPDVWLQNGSYFSQLEAGLIDTMDDAWIMTDDRLNRFRWGIH